jgi:nicotinamide-nucleotide amidase
MADTPPGADDLVARQLSQPAGKAAGHLVAPLVTHLVAQLADLLLARGWRLATAESCTGGLVAAACTELAGSSQWFERGVVSYSNAAKNRWLGVPAALIEADGAVSESVARAMAQGAQLGRLTDRADADAGSSGPMAGAAADTSVEVALGVTGVAGPGGGSAAKPVGTVCFGWALPGRCWSERRHFDGDRADVRRQSVDHALAVLVAALRADGASDPGRP